jgi:aminoglycoside/choline kinase family phosphotransferase
LLDRPAERERLIAGFLARAGWGTARRARLAGDASFRKYDRVTDGTRTAVLMDAPPPMEDVRPFLKVGRHLAALGFGAPAVLAEDVDAGLLLLEDLGDDTYTRLLAGGGGERPLYALAVDVLVALHRLPPERALPPGLPPYDDARLLAEACLLTDWFMPAALGRPTAPEARADYVARWTDLFPLARTRPATLVLRDYHVDNLLLLPGRQGTAACGLLDFQDAVAGPPEYDLMSLLEDARRDIADDLAADMLGRYYAAFPTVDRAASAAAYAVLGAQRHAKVIGIFTRLCVRDGKPGYLTHIPRVWRLLERALAHPALAAVAEWLDRHLPAEARRAPPALVREAGR